MRLLSVVSTNFSIRVPDLQPTTMCCFTELQRTKIDSQPSTSPPGGRHRQCSLDQRHSAIGDSPNMTSATMNIRGQTTKALDDAVFGARSFCTVASEIVAE